MDQRQQYDTCGYGYSESGTRGYKGGDFVYGYRPYYLPERHEAYEHKPMVSSLAHTHHGCHTGRRSLGGEGPNFQPGLGNSPLHNPYVASSPETSDKCYAYSGNLVPQGIANGYGPAGLAFQGRMHRRSQGCGMSDLIQGRSETISRPGQLYPDSISPYGSKIDWRPNVSPTEQMSASFNDALSFSHRYYSTICANCRNHSHLDGVSVYHSEQRDVNSTTDWRLQGARYSLRPTEENVPSNRQLPTQDTRPIGPRTGRLDVPYLEQTKSRFPFRKSGAASTLDNIMTVHADEGVANNGLTKKRKRKSRTIKPRKPRTLTDEGKAHAKAVRECPGGACADCRQKKIKARDPLVTNLVFQHAYNSP